MSQAPLTFPDAPDRANRRLGGRAGVGLLLGVAMLSIAGACQSWTPNPDKPHHTADGFRNNYSYEQRGRLDFWKWKWDRLLGRYPERGEDAHQFPMAANDPAFLRGNRGKATLTWIGHATILLQLNGVNILTDPHFSERASPFSWTGPQRHIAPGIPREELPPIDIVLISHNHYDHLDVDSVRYLSTHHADGGGPRFFVPLGLKAWFLEQGISNVVELDWWEQARYMGLQLRAVPAQHFSARGLFDRDEMLWASWVLTAGDFRFMFSGDSGYSKDYADIRERLGPMDLSALPIGSYEPRWFMAPMHLNPAEAVQVHRDLGSRYSMAMHWGTFDMTDELPNEPPQALARSLRTAGISPQRFFLMKHGETRLLEPLFPKKLSSP
ncbi:MAG: MBL fold metallo-hydrolase [SAR324 cluster bacterium]|nr:MBL fold metallo-hydrolase [SAR324 cluster bacterium]